MNLRGAEQRKQLHHGYGIIKSHWHLMEICLSKEYDVSAYADQDLQNLLLKTFNVRHFKTLLNLDYIFKKKIRSNKSISITEDSQQ